MSPHPAGSPDLSQKGSILPAVVAAVVAALRADVELAARLTDEAGVVKVWSLVPMGTVAPYLWVLSGAEFDAPKKLGAGQYGRTCTVTVAPVSKYRGTQEIDELGSLVMDVLERMPIVVPGWREAGIVWDETHPPVALDVEGGPQFLRELVFRASAR